MATLVKPDGTTTCCNAYTSIHMDGGQEYCKKCYHAVDGYIGKAAEAPVFTFDLRTKKLRKGK